MRILLMFMLMFSPIWATEYKLKYWKEGEVFSSYLTRHKIDSTKFYSQIDPDDIKFLSSIVANSPFFENVKNGVLQEALIPIGEKMQIFISRKKGGKYRFDIIPLKCDTIRDTVTVEIESSCFVDIKKATNNAHLATYLKRIFKERVNFKKLKKGDIVSIKYRQKSIKGLPWDEPIIEAAYIKRGDNEYFALRSNDDYQIWSNKAQTIVTNKKVVKEAVYKKFAYPLSHIRVTSKFTYKRWHPILHKFRPHLGIDFGAKRGTPIYALSSGKVIYAGWMRGYGKVTKIAHGNGIVSLYAHQSKILVKVGQKVEAHQVIGKVGSTGRSTGPHLHLGLYKRGKPVNPANYIGRSVKIKDGIVSTKNIKIVHNLVKELPLRAKLVYNSLKNNRKKNYRWKNLKGTVNIATKEKERVRKHAARVQLSITKGDA